MKLVYFNVKNFSLYIKKKFIDNTDCPKCHFMIHQSHPSHYVAFDRTVQDIVYKLVPGLQTEEFRRREKFIKRFRKVHNKLTENDCRETSSSENVNEDEQQGIFILLRFFFHLGCNNLFIKEYRRFNFESALEIFFFLITNNLVANEKDNEQNQCCSADQNPAFAHHRRDESVFLHLVPDGKLKSLERSYLRVSGRCLQFRF